MKKNILAALVSLFLLGTLLCAGCSQEEDRSMTAVEIAGTAEIRLADEDDWNELKAEDVIAIGSTLRTSDDGYIHLSINDGTHIGLSPGTEVQLTELSLKMQNPTTEFELLNGDFFVVVTKALGSGHFTVNTELGRASIVGSVMSVIYDETGRVINILCYEGEAEAERGIGAVSLKSGNAATGSGDGSQFTTQPISVVQAQKTAKDTCWWTKDGHKIYPEQYAPSPSPKKTPKPTPASSPTPAPAATPEVTIAPTATATPPMQTLRPTLAPEKGTLLSPEEASNEGTYSYSFSASYKNGASGPTSGTLEITVEFSGNQVSLTSGGQSNTFYKVAENTYEAADESGYVTVMEFTATGFTGSAWGGDWTYTRG